MPGGPLLPETPPDERREEENDEGRRLMFEDEESPRYAGLRRGTIPLLEEHIIIDDQRGTKVLVFPKVKAMGGTIDPDAMIAEPMKMCRQIFVRGRNWSSHLTIDETFDAFLHGPVSALLYHEIVRAKILQVLHGLGLQVASFNSIDGDEIFIKIWLDNHGEVVRDLAQRYQYKVPFRKEAYASMEPSGTYPGSKPMENSNGRPAVAYTHYEAETSEDLEAFRDIDVIRLMELCLDEWLDISELMRQGVVLHAFTAASYEQVKALHHNWGTLTKLCELPNNNNIDDIRDYFGEEVAFFFRFFAFYTRMLVPLAVVGFACGLGERKIMAKTVQANFDLQVLFTFLLIGWASVYNTLFRHQTARDRQRWGMKDHEETLLERPAFQPLLEGTFKLKVRICFARIFPVIYCLLFVIVVLGNEHMKKLQRITGIRWIPQNRYVSTAVLIKAFSLLWNRIAPCLANIENHRTQGRWNNAMISILGSVKLFVTLFPFIQEAFIKVWLLDYCGPTLPKAIGLVYGRPQSWPSGVPSPEFVNGTVEVPPGMDLRWLDGYHFNNTDGQTCIRGCYPKTCFPHTSGNMTTGYSCATNCIIGLQKSLESVYLLHVVCTVAFILIPIALTRLAVEEEIVKEKAEGKFFTLLQLQAKCCAYASYEYMSWGGSQVEDFLELAIGYALLTCFGIIVPAVSVLALVSHMVEYRLLAYRMTNITCRPFPLSSDGIGGWQSVFDFISMFAISTNVGLAVSQMHPMRSWPLAYKLVAFVVMEHFLAGVYFVLTFVLPPVPKDVQRIEDFNSIFKRKNAWRRPLKVPVKESCDLTDVDISAMSRGDSRPQFALGESSDPQYL